MEPKYQKIAAKHITKKGESLNKKVLLSKIFTAVHVLAIFYVISLTPEGGELNNYQGAFMLTGILSLTYIWVYQRYRAANALRAHSQGFRQNSSTQKYFSKNSILTQVFGKKVTTQLGGYNSYKDGFELFGAIGHLIQLGTLQDEANYGNASQNKLVGFPSIQLVAVTMRTGNQLPHVYIDSRKNNSLELGQKGGFIVSRVLKKTQQVKLEGNLDTHLRFFTNEHEANNALAVFGPDIMLELQQHLQEFDLEVDGHNVTLLSFKKYSKLTEADVGRQLAAAHFVKDRFIPMFQKHLHQDNTAPVNAQLFTGGASALVSYSIYALIKGALYTLLFLILFGYLLEFVDIATS